jgi:hypothetical protein
MTRVGVFAGAFCAGGLAGYMVAVLVEHYLRESWA